MCPQCRGSPQYRGCTEALLRDQNQCPQYRLVLTSSILQLAEGLIGDHHWLNDGWVSPYGVYWVDEEERQGYSVGTIMFSVYPDLPSKIRRVCGILRAMMLINRYYWRLQETCCLPYVTIGITPIVL